MASPDPSSLGGTGEGKKWFGFLGVGEWNLFGFGIWLLEFK